MLLYIHRLTHCLLPVIKKGKHPEFMEGQLPPVPKTNCLRENYQILDFKNGCFHIQKNKGSVDTNPDVTVTKRRHNMRKHYSAST